MFDHDMNVVLALQLNLLVLNVLKQPIDTSAHLHNTIIEELMPGTLYMCRMRRITLLYSRKRFRGPTVIVT